MTERMNLNMEDLEMVTGGYRTAYTTFAGMVYEALVDNNGDVLATFKTAEESYDYCVEHGLKTQFIRDYQLENLRTKGTID